MKKNSFLTSAHWVLIFTMFVGAFVSSCNKKSDPTPAPAATAKIFTSVVTPQTVTSGSANVVGTVTTSDGSAYLKLEVTSTTNIDHVYITTSEDNGPMSAYVPTSNYTDSLNNTFTAGGGSASYTSSNTKNFTLLVPVSIRTTSSAVSDVYVVWFTNGNGSFTLPSKNKVLGPVTFTLNYVANAGPSYSTVTGIVLGDQYASPGSLLVTSGQVSALNTASYNDSPSSADLSLSELSTPGTARTGAPPTYTGGPQGSGGLWLVSPSERANLGYVNEPGASGSAVTIAPNMTYISTPANTIDFDAATGATLSALTVGSSEEVLLVQGGVYQFQTAGGKKGLIKVTSLTPTTSTTGGTATVSVKVLN
jgi:hypothetical protein